MMNPDDSEPLAIRVDRLVLHAARARARLTGLRQQLASDRNNLALARRVETAQHHLDTTDMTLLGLARWDHLLGEMIVHHLDSAANAELTQLASRMRHVMEEG